MFLEVGSEIYTYLAAEDESIVDPASHRDGLHVEDPVEQRVAAAPMFGQPARQILGGSDVIATGGAAEDVNPSHIDFGLGGTRTHNQRLKRALLYH
jgi:hypothetical protein